MKKFLKIIGGGIFCALMMFGCSDLAELNSDSGNENLGTLYFDSKSRFVDVNGISTATVNVYGYGMNTISKSGVTVNGGKGTLAVENIPVGKNRVIEISGYKTADVPVKILYALTDINSGANSIGTIKDGADSAKGKAYLALLNAGVNISSVSLGGFDGVSSAYLFDADGFASTYRNGSSVSAESYVQKTGTVKFTNIKSASGYSVWIDDPLSEKLSIDSNSITTSSLSGVAPGTWKVYVNDGSTTKVAGTVTVPSDGSADFDTLIGNALAGKTVIFVKADADTIYVWYDGSTNALNGSYPGNSFTSADCSEYMNDATGWKMLDISKDYDKSKGTIDFILCKGGNKITSDDKKSTRTSTFWYDYNTDTFYDSDPTTTPTLDSDATLKEIKVNGTSIGFVEKYEVPLKTEKVTVTAVANSTKATVSVSPSGETPLAVGESKSFTITVTAEDGTVKTYSLSVTRKAEAPEDPNDVTLSSIKINGSSIGELSGTSFTKSLSGSGDSCSVTVTAEANSTSATVTVSPSNATIADGKTTTFTITVKNGSASATYTLTVDYTKVEGSQYYWTNKNGAVGVNKTISSFSDWTEDMKISQGAANDDPRVYCKWSMHEPPNDAYALFAAYDNDNLYLMVELSNVQDIVAPQDNYPLSDNGQFWNRGTPFFFAFETGKGVGGTGAMVSTGDPYIWNSAVEFSNKNVDTMIVCHSNPAKGTPGVFRTNTEGLFDYKNGLCETFTENNISVSWDGGANKTQGLVSKNLYGIKAVGTDQGRLTANIHTDAYIDFNELGHNSNLDLKWQITIPLSALKISKSELESTGIGVMFVISDGASGMDCLPWDETMVDVAAEPFSQNDSNSKEKEDTDYITVPFARIGHM